MTTMTYTEKQVAKAAHRVTPVWICNPTIKEMYGFCEPIVDMKATMRRVAMFAKGSGRAHMSPEEIRIATEIVDGRTA